MKEMSILAAHHRELNFILNTIWNPGISLLENMKASIKFGLPYSGCACSESNFPNFIVLQEESGRVHHIFNVGPL